MKWLFFILVFLFFLRPLSIEGDFYHHLNTGRFVIEHHSLPQTDEYTFTESGKAWVGYGWGMGLIFYLIYSHFGSFGISIFLGFLASLTIALLYFYLRTLKVSSNISLLLAGVTACLLSFRYPARPEIVTYPMVISFLLIDELKSKHPKLVLLYPLLTLIWANTYGAGVFVGLTLLGLLGIKQLTIDHFGLRKRPLFYILLLVTCYLSFFNGYGLKSIFYIFYIPSVAKIQGEWAGIIQTLMAAPPSYLDNFRLWLLGYILYSGFFIFTVIKSFKRLKSFPFFLLLSFFIFAPVFAFRQLGLAVVLSIPLFALLLDHFKSKKIFWAAVCITILLMIFSLKVNPIGIASELPGLHLINFIKQHNLKGNILNNQDLGSYLTYHLYPESKVSYDTRDELFSATPYLNDLMKTRNIVDLAHKYKADLIVLNFDPNNLSYKYLLSSESWTIVYFQDGYLVAVPNAFSSGR